MTGFGLPFEADDFPPGVPANGNLACSWPGLLRSATSLGGRMAGSGGTGGLGLPGTALEFAWRAALVAANLRQQHGPNRALMQTDQYRSLDPSEKGAVSFFLGQVSAKHFAEHLLLAPVFTRVDEALQLAGLPLTGRRPDFYGWGPAVGVFAVEAKGRSGTWSAPTMQRAKTQALRLPPVLGEVRTLPSLIWPTSIAAVGRRGSRFRRRDGGRVVGARAWRRCYSPITSRSRSC